MLPGLASTARRPRRSDRRLGEQRDADPDQPGLTASDRAHRGDGVSEVGEQTAPVVQQFRACLGEFDAAPRPVEELHVELSFQPCDGLRQARLHLLAAARRPDMRRRAQTALAGLFTSGLLIAMAAAATGAGAAGGPGTLDASFGTGGHALIPGNSGSPIALGITALGLDAAGDVFALPQHVEFSPAGQQDATVTPAAITAASHGGADAFLPSGQYVHVAFSSSPTNRKDVDGQLQRFNADGTLASASPAFDFTANESTSHEGANAVALQANGQAVVAGAQDGVAGVARFNADGSFDSAFGAGGRVTTANPGGSAGFIAVLVQPDGKILASGEGNTPTQNELFLARYLG